MGSSKVICEFNQIGVKHWWEGYCQRVWSVVWHWVSVRLSLFLSGYKWVLYWCDTWNICPRYFSRDQRYIAHSHLPPNTEKEMNKNEIKEHNKAKLNSKQCSYTHQREKSCQNKKLTWQNWKSKQNQKV